MANMTVGSETYLTTRKGKPSRIRKVTFTHTSAGTAAGDVATAFTITGELLRAVATRCDAAWDFLLTDGTATIFAITGIATAAAGAAVSIPLYMTSASGEVTDDETHFEIGIPMVNEYLTCTTANVSAVAPTITVYWRESD